MTALRPVFSKVNIVTLFLGGGGEGGHDPLVLNLMNAMELLVSHFFVLAITFSSLKWCFENEIWDPDISNKKLSISQKFFRLCWAAESQVITLCSLVLYQFHHDNKLHESLFN